MTIKKPKAKEKANQVKGNPGRGGAQPGAGRPAFVPTDAERKQVEALSGYGLPFEQIAVLVRGGIGIDTLMKHFSEELVAGKGKANAKIGQTLFQKAASGDTAAMIWWSKTQMRWAETQKLEHTGKDGAPLAQPTLTEDHVRAIAEAILGR
jgi:hypothetical protein